MSLSSSFFSSDILFRALKKSCISLSKSFFLHVVVLLLFLLRHSFSSAQEVLHLFVKVLLPPCRCPPPFSPPTFFFERSRSPASLCQSPSASSFWLQESFFGEPF